MVPKRRRKLFVKTAGRRWSTIKAMWIRGASGLALSLLLVLTSLVDLAGHEHAASRQHASQECAIDHQRDHAPLVDAPGGAPTPHLAAAGERHEHQCLGCRLSGLRIALAPLAVAVGLGLAAEASATPCSLSRTLVSWTGRTTRGPPSA